MKCGKCKEDKDIGNFEKSSEWVTGYHPYCIQCLDIIRNTPLYKIKRRRPIKEDLQVKTIEREIEVEKLVYVYEKYTEEDYKKLYEKLIEYEKTFYQKDIQISYLQDKLLELNNLEKL